LGDESSSIDSYTKSKQIFVNASGKLQTLLSSDVARGQIVNMPQETSMFHIINASPVPEPSVASTSGATFLSSLEQIRVGSTHAISLIENIKDNPKVAHELELSLIEICMTKGFDEARGI
jgi:hypothetical protein